MFGKIIGSVLGSVGANKAGKAATQTLNQQIDFLNQILGKTENVYQPYVDTGKSGLTNLADILLKGDQSKFYESPAYQFNLSEGQRGIQNILAKGGLRHSTAALRNASKFNQGMASNEFQNFLKNLFGLTDVGTGGADALTNARLGIGQIRAGTAGQLAEARAARKSGMFAPFAGSGTEGSQAILSILGLGG